MSWLAVGSEYVVRGNRLQFTGVDAEDDTYTFVDVQTGKEVRYIFESPAECEKHVRSVDDATAAAGVGGGADDAEVVTTDEDVADVGDGTHLAPFLYKDAFDMSAYEHLEPNHYFIKDTTSSMLHFVTKEGDTVLSISKLMAIGEPAVLVAYLKSSSISTRARRWSSLVPSFPRRAPP